MNALISGLGALLVLVFLSSGAGKLVARRSSGRSIRALRLERWVGHARGTVTLVAAVELSCAGGLSLTRGPVFVASSFVAWALVVVFLVVTIRAARLGSSDECGCFGDLSPSTVGAAMVRRNVVLVVAASVAIGAAGGRLVEGGSPSLLGGGAESAGAIAVAVIAFAGAAVASTESRSTRPSAGLARVHSGRSPSAASLLVAPDGEVVDPFQRALRGRAQLLIFVRPGCSSCDEIMAGVGASQLGSVEPRVVIAVGDGGSMPREVRDGASSLTLRAHADPGGALARQIGMPEVRPAAALVTITGSVLMPLAEGRDEVRDLITAIIAAQVEITPPGADAPAC